MNSKHVSNFYISLHETCICKYRYFWNDLNKSCDLCQDGATVGCCPTGAYYSAVD